MENYFNEYIPNSYINGINYSTSQNEYPLSYSNYSEYNLSPTINYSNNVNFNDFNNSNNIFSPIETSFSTFEASNNFNVKNSSYRISNIKILPPIYIPDKVTYPIQNINYNNNDLNNYNNFIDNNDQGSYQDIPYIDNTNANNISSLEYNNMPHPIDAFLTNNILEMTASSSNTLDYGTTITPISYNNNDIESNNYAYTPEFDRQNNVLFKSFEPTHNKQNSNLISDLRNSYFNHNDTPYSIFSYNQNQIHDSLNYSSLSNDFLNYDVNMRPRYSVSSVPISSYKFQNGAEVKTEIVPIEEIELIPVKKTKYIKRTTIKYPIRKISVKPQTSTIKTQTIRRSLIKPMPMRKTYYFPKDKIQPRYNIQVSSRPSSPIRNSGRLEPLSPSSSYMADYPHDNYAGAGIYSPRVYRINLNEKKTRKKKFY